MAHGAARPRLRLNNGLETILPETKRRYSRPIQPRHHLHQGVSLHLWQPAIQLFHTKPGSRDTPSRARTLPSTGIRRGIPCHACQLRPTAQLNNLATAASLDTARAICSSGNPAQRNARIRSRRRTTQRSTVAPATYPTCGGEPTQCHASTSIMA